MREAARIVLAVGALALVAAGLLSSTREVFSLGVTPVGPAADLTAGERVCQRAVEAPPGTPEVSAVRVRARATGALDTRVRIDVGGASGTARVAPSDGASVRVPLDERVDVTAPRDVCVANAGPARVQLFGNGGIAARTSILTLNGTDIGTDLALVFDGEPRSFVRRLPALLEAAALWRPGWVTPVSLGVFLLLIIAASAALLLVALPERRPKPALEDVDGGVPGPARDPLEPRG